MANAGPVNYQIIIGEESVNRIASYHADLINKKAIPGRYLRKAIPGDLSKLSIYEFIELLLSTKQPQIFAEQDVSCDGTDWTSREFSLLGDINVAVRVLAYDNGLWNGSMSIKYKPPLGVELLFSPGVMLRPMNSSKKNNPDYQEVVEGSKINQEKYTALVQRRLLPLFSYVNNQAENRKKALVVLPGLGCGQFAGKFKGKMEDKLHKALQFIIETHTFPNIKGIFLGLYMSGLNAKEEINGVIYEVTGFSLPQLSHPEKYDKIFRDCQLYKVVAWDHVSLPGNDFFCNNTRCTDDGVSAAATNVMEMITGVKGIYKNSKYYPPESYKDWEAVAKAKNIKLIANKNNIKIVSQDGQIKET